MDREEYIYNIKFRIIRVPARIEKKAKEERGVKHEGKKRLDPN
jgi:hypothetical protein